MKISEMKQTRDISLFGLVQQMRMCPECLRNIEPGCNVDEIWEVSRKGQTFLVTDSFCPHCGLGINPAVYTIH